SLRRPSATSVPHSFPTRRSSDLHNPMIPHTLVFEPGLRIFKIYSGYWFFGRPTVEELRLDLRTVLQRCRPDWDISSTNQRTAWRSEEHTSELQSLRHLVCRLLLE